VATIGLSAVFGLGGFLGSMILLKGLWPLLIILGIISFFFIIYFMLVSVLLPLSTYKEGVVNFKKILSNSWSLKLIVKSAGMVLLVGISALLGGYILYFLGSKLYPALGVSLFAIWVAYIAVRFAFAIYILIDTKSSIVSALKISHSMMKHMNGWRFLVFIILVVLISLTVQMIGNLFGFLSPILPKIIGFVFTVFFTPWLSLLSIMPYMQIKG